MPRTPHSEQSQSEQAFLSQERSLVPAAERPNYTSPHDFEETSTETIWENPFDYDVAVKLHVGSTPRPDKSEAGLAAWRALPEARRREYQTGQRVYLIRAKSRRSIPSEFDQAIQQTQCTHAECPGPKGLHCRNPEHLDHRMIVGGLYPRLLNRGTQQRPLATPPMLHASLDDQKARAEEMLAQAKAKLNEAAMARDALLVAQANLLASQQQLAETETRMAEKNVLAEDAKANANAVAEAVGKPAGSRIK